MERVNCHTPGSSCRGWSSTSLYDSASTPHLPTLTEKGQSETVCIVEDVVKVMCQTGHESLE